MCMTHGHAHHFLLLSLSLVIGAVSTAACQTATGPVESRQYPGGDSGYESSSGESSSTGEECSSSSGGESSSGGYDSGYDSGDSCEYGDYGCETKSCTLTQGYWKNHNIKAQNKNQQLAWPVIYPDKWPVSEYTELGGKGEQWLSILETPPKGNPWYICAHQWIAAKLNIKSNNGAPAEVISAVTELEAYLKGNYYSPCSGKEDALKLAKFLDDYNNGKVGPPHCGEMEDPGQIEPCDYEADVCGGKVKTKNNLGLKAK